jgi:hypothetical protein
MGTTPIYGFPYPDPSDLVANYPALGQQLAEDVETEIAAASKIVQVVSATSTTSTATTSLTFVTMNLSATITPTTNTNKVLVIAHFTFLSSAGGQVVGTLLRGATNLGNGVNGMTSLASAGVAVIGQQAINYLDSPATTSATTYAIHFRVDSGTGTAQDKTQLGAITLIEVAA